MRPFFDHSRHILRVWDNDLHLDVLAFRGDEGLSELFRYAIEFTCTAQDIDAEQLLGRQASFSLFARTERPPLRGFEMPEAKPLRTLYGVLTGFKRLSGSRDEARYEVTLEPRLALLGRGQQFCVYQQQSVPQIVESILRERHGFRGQDLFLNVRREYPQREQVMQYGESDLAFICRLLAEVGIWFLSSATTVCESTGSSSMTTSRATRSGLNCRVARRLAWAVATHTRCGICKATIRLWNAKWRFAVTFTPMPLRRWTPK